MEHRNVVVTQEHQEVARHWKPIMGILWLGLILTVANDGWSLIGGAPLANSFPGLMPLFFVAMIVVMRQIRRLDDLAEKAKQNKNRDQ